jgi:2-succinyl-6-hydroxy-2,4-cyclohexadiene-1-carboxylate synthase
VSAEATTREATSSTLAAAVRGAGPDVVAVHGFAQNRACLGALGDALAARFRLTAPDAPGHGGSARHRRADVATGADLLVATGGRSAYVGYSMGGRLCLQAAIDHPDRVEALVLIGATPGIADDEDRAARRRSDALLAERLETVGLDAFLQEWLDLPMFAGLPDEARFDRERRTNTVDGLAESLRRAGTGSMVPLWNRLHVLHLPVLCVTGALDERYGQIAERMVAALGPTAEHCVIDGAGHAAHLERPEQTVEVVCAFLARALAP